MARTGNRVVVPEFYDEQNQQFWFCRLDAIERATHELDRRDAVREMLEGITDESLRHQYRFDQLIEEAINSSVLEGARLTTRAQAKAMIRNQRAPRSRGERMVMNNYTAMVRLQELAHTEMGLDDLLELHRILGEDALDCDGGAGRLRTVSDDVRIVDTRTGEVWFTPPSADELPARIARMLAFANNDNPAPFLHPLVRAIVLHFWLAYLHPFVDGNGRMARALFYWQMLRSKYDFAQYLSISGPIDRSPRSYYLAFCHTETDQGDLTYFLLHQLAVLRRATDDLVSHLKERSQRLNELANSLRRASELNGRQRSALSWVARYPQEGLTIVGHANSHGVTYLTARKDLLGLESAGHLKKRRVGKADVFYPTKKLLTSLQN
jgi:Fic family protein